MKGDGTEEKIGRMFDEMRREDSAGMPAFDRLTRLPADARAAPGPRTAPLVRLAAAALFAVCVGLALARLERVRAERELAQWAVLSNWQASTDSLLTSSSLPWSGNLRTTTDEWFDSALFPSEGVETEEKEEQTL